MKNLLMLPFFKAVYTLNNHSEEGKKSRNIEKETLAQNLNKF